MADLPLLSHDPAAAFAFRDRNPVPAGEFLAEAAGLAACLPDRGYVINLCADRLSFATAFAAALMRGQVSLMPPNLAPNTIDGLLRDYPGSYCLDEGFSIQDNRAPTAAHPHLSVRSTPLVAAVQIAMLAAN